MIKVPEVVQELIQNDEVALEALQAGLLNFSAYADVIHKKVEKLTFKPVKRGTIVVSLTRLAKKIKKSSPLLKPEVTINNLTVKSPLCILTYMKTIEAQRRVATLHPFLVSSSDIFAITENLKEITLLCSNDALKIIKKHMGDTPKHETIDVAAVTITYAKKYAAIPNILFVFFATLAARRINLIEVFSTYTELTFIVKKNDMETVLQLLNIYS